MLKPTGPLSVDPDFIAALTQVDLPGNARQVENLVRWALVNKDDETSLTLRDLPLDIWQQLSEQGRCHEGQSAPVSEGQSLPQSAPDIPQQPIALLHHKPVGPQWLEPRASAAALRTVIARGRAAQGAWESIAHGPAARDYVP